MIKGVAFDAYGTLFDVYSVLQKCEEAYPGSGGKISQLWRQKQLEYSWLRTLMGRYETFWHITEDALRFTLDTLGLDYDASRIDDILKAYFELDTYPDVLEALELLRPRPAVILTNGNVSMLDQLVANSSLDGHLDGILSADTVKLFKPRPEVYQLAVSHLALAPHEILFVSSNSWDVTGAKSFGFTVGWINRQNQPVEHLNAPPDYTASSLLALAQAIEAEDGYSPERS
ncbi:haloacid dehalogenase type II [Gordonibacter sp.]|uniref:haloacid dehalogenase type II n=1 Tax=Gordonibacter sp. TaxID=1968902 RepID=UPI002FCA1E59